ncbi:MAG TPA: hypothetical protein VGR38_09565 [Candidatus Polarisedimenticolia bacterium]|nr:hypothetical protein [Candidatus Polarisedimenticolia bacterium]
MIISRRFDVHTRLMAPLVARLSVVAVLVALGVSRIAAQTAAPETVVYRLKSTSTFQRGCFAPCLCPVMESGSERGTFLLTFTGFDGLFNHYRVDDVSWKIRTPGGELRATGSGTYKVGGEFAVQQQLELDLKVGDNPVEHFDSGLVAGGGEFPRIAITISVHGQVCFDTVFGVDASPVPLEEILSYRLQQESTFQRGCFDICDCAIVELPLRGGFSLVPIDKNPLFTEYSVVQVKWQVGPDPATGATSWLPVTGFGTYRLGGEFATAQEMGLDLRLGAAAPAFFDSGEVPGGNEFPLIAIQVSHEENSCVRTVLDLHARPVKVHASAAVRAEEPGP